MNNEKFNPEKEFKNAPHKLEIYYKLMNIMNVKDYLNKTNNGEYVLERGQTRVIGAIEMNDGVKISIQASSYHYSQPEKNIPYNEYFAFEICMNKKDVRTPPLKKYIDNSGIIAYVPIIDIINEIQMHDGLKDNQ